MILPSLSMKGGAGTRVDDGRVVLLVPLLEVRVALFLNIECTMSESYSESRGGAGSSPW